MLLCSSSFAALVAFAPQGPLQVELTPRNKEPLTATWAVTSVALDTDYGSATVKAGSLAQIQFGDPDVVLTDTGTELRGKLKLTSIDAKVDGKPRRFARTEIASLIVVRDGRPLGVPSFAGDWMTSFGPASLTQRGASVKGSYGWGGDAGIEGKVENGVLLFKYDDGNGSQQAKWELLDGGDAFTGGYGSGKDEGFWGGYRKQAVAAAAKPGEVASGQTKVGLRYHVRLPKAHADGKSWPAICILHGSNMDSRAYVDTIVSAWPELAEQLVVVGLDGEKLSSGSKAGALRFNYSYINFSGPNVGPPWVHQQSPALVADALRQLGKELPVARWFLGGHSQGGFLTYCLVMYYPELIVGALPMSCNLLVQCEPDIFDAAQAAKQHRVAVAVIHGKKDNVVEYSGGAYCNLRMLDGGFPSVRLFAPEQVGHQFALLPVDEALRWALASTSTEPAELVAFGEQSAAASAWRDVGAALRRLAEQKPPAALQARTAALEQQLAAAAGADANRLRDAIAGNKDGGWVDDFLAFRSSFATAAAAKPALDAYAQLRQQQRKQGDELFAAARKADSVTERNEVYRQILTTCYATKWYEAVKLWMQ